MDLEAALGREQTTRILRGHDGAGPDALDLERLLPDVHCELRRIAGHLMARERSDHTLQATALVNEVFLRLANADEVPARGRDHFIAIAARAMRQVLVDHARKKQAEKRGGAHVRVPLTEALAQLRQPDLDVLALEDALGELQQMDPRKAQVVELRFFGGMSLPAIASVVARSQTTVEEDWYAARAWLRARLR